MKIFFIDKVFYKITIEECDNFAQLIKTNVKLNNIIRVQNELYKKYWKVNIEKIIL